MTKRCIKCGIAKNANEFHKNKEHKDDLTSQCGMCRNERGRQIDKTEKGREYYRKYRKGSKHRNCYLKRNYNITLEQYNTMFIFQGGVCAICGCPEITKVKNVIKRLSVDHNHITGKVRGLLCMKCNQALGLLNENPVIIKSLLRYIIKND